MFWQEEEDRQAKICDNVVDLMFEIRCRNLPVDHAYDLSNALLQVAPWIADEPQIGVHTVHVAGSQNGWERPDPESGQQLQLSRRTKLTIRVPRERQDAVQQALTGYRRTSTDCRRGENPTAFAPRDPVRALRGPRTG